MTETLSPTAEPQTSVNEIKELGISIVANNLNPSMLTPNFLISTGIMPSDSQLTRQPVLTANRAQLNFRNGLNIVAQPRIITFTQGIGNKELSELKGPEIALTYVEKLPNAQYQRVSILPKFLVTLNGEEDAGRKFITETLIAQGPWHNFGEAPIQAGVNLLYKLEQCQLNLSVNEAKLQQAEQATKPAILFSGQFNYNVASDNQQERTDKLRQALSNWQSNLETFQKIINQGFLAQNQKPMTA